MTNEEKSKLIGQLMASHDAVVKEAMKNWQDDWPAIPQSVFNYTDNFLLGIKDIIKAFKD